MHFKEPVLHHLIQAFHWTLIHSLWQGLILAICTGLVLFLTPQSKPALRYNLLTFLLGLFLMGGGLTFYLEYHGLNPPFESVSEVVESSVSYQLANHHSAYQSSDLITNTLYTVLDFSSAHAPIIVLLWFTIFILKAIQATTGLFYINRLRHQGIQSATPLWQGKLNTLAARLHIEKHILLMESSKISVPTVVGFFKPMILVPIGFINHIPQDQVEAILLHELAHIRRHDLAINLFQNIAESIYFFNPAVLWISHLIREEREHCCDDIALEVLSNKNILVNALVGFQDYKLNDCREAVAFASKRNHLLDRIKRIMFNNNKQLDAMEKLFVTTSLLTVTVLFAAFSQDLPKTPQPPTPPNIENIAPPTPPVPPVEPVEPTNPPTPIHGLGNNRHTIHITRDNKRYEIDEVDGKLESLKINGISIPKKDLEKYDSEVQKIIDEVGQERIIDEEEAIEHTAQSQALQKQAEELRKQAELVKREVNMVMARVELDKKIVDAQRIDIEAAQNVAKKVSSEIQKMNSEVIRHEVDKLRRMVMEVSQEARKLKVEQHEDEKGNENLNQNSEEIKNDK